MPDESETYKNRDTLLGEIHQSCKATEEWCKAHDEKDDIRFKEINKKMLIGALAIVVLAFATNTLPEIIAYFKP